MSTDTIIVVGLGRSAYMAATELQQFTTIGVNDVARFLSPNYLVVLDSYRRFPDPRLLYIDLCPAKVAYICHETWQSRMSGVESTRLIELQMFNSKVDINSNKVFKYRTSPFAAAHLAYKLGAKKIGIIGMDLLNDHHMSRHSRPINLALGSMAEKMADQGVELVNCSPIANLHALPYKPLGDML